MLENFEIIEGLNKTTERLNKTVETKNKSNKLFISILIYILEMKRR
ncbi:MAG: hypothetical protein QXW80_06230 [Candidatus Micrarchaeia archaeon]